MTHLTVPEWGRAPVGPRGFTVFQAETLMAAARAHPLGGKDGSGILSDHRHYLRAGQMVGVLAAPGCSLEILPKVDPETPDEHTPSVRRRLIALLDLALGLDLGDGRSATMERGAGNLLEILIQIFAEQLLAQTRRGLPRLYLPHDDDLPALRGRIDVMRQFTHHAVRPDRIACRYDELSNDIPLLRIMKAAVLTVRRISRVPETQRLLDELRFVFADIADVPVHSLPWDRVRIDRTNKRWESLMALARLLIKRDWQSTSHNVHARDGISLLFPMNDLFEAAVTTLLKRAVAGSGIEVIAQGGLRHCLGEWQIREDCIGHIFQTRPDIILRKREETLAIIDTKWKSRCSAPLDRKKGVAQADVYQMMAYARLYRCDRLALLYPASPGTTSGIVGRFGIDGGRELLTISEIDISATVPEIQLNLAKIIAHMQLAPANLLAV